MAGIGEPAQRAGSALDLSAVRLSGDPLTSTPLNGGDDLVLMGRAEDVSAVLRAVADQPGTRALPAPAGEGREARERLGRWLQTHTGVTDTTRQQEVLTRVGLASDVGPRTRIEDLSLVSRARLRFAAVVLVGETAADVTHVVLDSPFADVPGHQRAGLRSILVRELRTSGLGAVLSTDSPVDALVLGARTIELDAEQVAQEGGATSSQGRPRGGGTAALGGADVMSGLARRGWLSIGHSQVRRRTDLDGKVYLAIPTDAVTLSVDEFDPAFRGESVFEVIVIGIRDEGSLLQVRLSPADNEAGLPLVADVLDASSRRAWGAITPALGGEATPGGPIANSPGEGVPDDRTAAAEPGGASAADAPAPGTWALLQPGLGPDLESQLGRITMGSRLWAEVDTQRIHVWSVEE